jgi:hypothetical protein
MQPVINYEGIIGTPEKKWNTDDKTNPLHIQADTV